MGGWKPTLKEKYAETFKEDFTLVGETGPISERGIDKYTIEYKVLQPSARCFSFSGTVGCCQVARRALADE